jgi:hypothetical protein
VSSASFASEARFHHDPCQDHHENLRTYIYLNNDSRVSKKMYFFPRREPLTLVTYVTKGILRIRTKCVASSYYTSLLTVSGEPYAVKVARTVRWERDGRPSYGSVINYSRPNLLTTIIVPLALTSN